MQSVTQDFQNQWDAASMTVLPQVVIEFGNNKFNGAQTCTASSEKLLRTGIEGNKYLATTVHYWTPDEAFNNKNKNTMKWAVADRCKCDGGYRAINLRDAVAFLNPDEVPLTQYEHGWWSANKSDGSGIFAVPEWVQTIFETPRNINQVDVHFTEGYPNMKSVTIQYQDGNGVWQNVSTNFALTANVYDYSFPLYQSVVCQGLRIYINSTQNANDYARINELQGLFIADVSSDVSNFDLRQTREQYDGTVPVGIVKADEISLVLDNTTGNYSPSNTSSPYYPYVSHDNKITVGFAIQSGQFIGGGKTSSNFSTGAPSYGAFGYGGDSTSTQYETIQMGIFYTDQWSADANGYLATVGARDYSKYLQDNLVGYAKFWTFSTVADAIDDLLNRAGKSDNEIHIDQFAITTFPLLYIKDTSFWNFLAEVAFADQAQFGFDQNGDFYYRSYTALYQNQTPVYTYSDTRNIIDGVAKTELYLNSVIVLVADVTLDNMGTRPIWTPPSDENQSSIVLSWNYLGAGISSTDTTINCTMDNGVQLFNSDGYISIDDELISYTGISGGQFTGCTRGVGGTAAANHSSGAYVGEARYYRDFAWEVYPVLSANYPYCTAIDFIAEAYGLPQAAIMFYDFGPFGGSIAFTNTVPYFTPLQANGDGPYVDQLTPLDWVTVIAGQAPLHGNKTRLGKAPAATLRNQRLIRRHGIAQIEVSNKWIQTQAMADRIASILIDEYNSPRSVIELNIVGYPAIELGDRVTFTNFPGLGITNKDYHVLNLDYHYDGGLACSVSLREVKP